jgi:hypothetical protein
MEKLTNDQMENLVGGTTELEYCMTLAAMWNSGGWQGGMTLFAQTWLRRCSDYDFAIA